MRYTIRDGADGMNLWRYVCGPSNYIVGDRPSPAVAKWKGTKIDVNY